MEREFGLKAELDKKTFLFLFFLPLSHEKNDLSAPQKYFQNLLQRAEATQFNPCFQVKEIAIEDVELVKCQWFQKTSKPSEMRRFIDYAFLCYAK